MPRRVEEVQDELHAWSHLLVLQSEGWLQWTTRVTHAARDSMCVQLVTTQGTVPWCAGPKLEARAKRVQAVKTLIALYLV